MIMVANCLVKMTRSLSLTFLKVAKMSLFPTPCSFMSMTRRPCWRRVMATLIVSLPSIWSSTISP